jgi:hypothetical protein
MGKESEIGMKFDDNKLMYELVPPTALEGLVRVLTHGAVKYAPENWRKVVPIERYYAALMRHLEAVRKGEMIDPDSGLLHMDHVMCNAMFLRELGFGKAK